jgi:hypothetical protein
LHTDFAFIAFPDSRSSEVAQMQKVVATIDSRIDAVNQQLVHRSHVVDCDGARK